MHLNTKTRIAIVLAAIVAAILFILPTAYREQFGTGWISRPLSLGLDLKGGVHLVYQVETKEAVKSRLQGSANAIKADLRKDKIAVLRAIANDRAEIELTMLDSNATDRIKTKLAEDYPQLRFVDVRPDGARSKLAYTVSAEEIVRIEQEAVVQAIETLRNRVDQFGVSEPLIQKTGTDRILLQMPGVSDIGSVKKLVGSVAKLEFRLVPRPGSAEVAQTTMKNRSGDPVLVEEDIQMSGDAVADARVGLPDGKVEVSLQLTAEGSQIFKNVTTTNVGRELAIILDNVVYSSPRINEPIGGGRASITGAFTMEEARQLAIVLRAGALPAPLIVMEERQVGPTLGAESIKSGVMAIAIGAGAIFLFMGFYYRKSGLLADVTLALNLLFILGCLSGFGATLTLPGLAGLALTIGMAVDANVLIFERIREELRNGSSRDVAVSAGFDKALSAITDSNITTLLTGLILYYFGTGPIRGFAVTLCIGVMTTIFCATFVSRLLFDLFKLKGRSAELSI